MSAPHPALVTLRENVDRFMARVLAKHRDVMACAAGCADCCAADLTVFPVEAAPLAGALEALPQDLRDAVRDRARRGAHCALLVGSRCSVYGQRPIICRTQGLPLRLEDGGVTGCPRNFGRAAETIPPDDHLDLPRLNMMLAVLHGAYLKENGLDDVRIRLADLAASLAIGVSRP